MRFPVLYLLLLVLLLSGCLKPIPADPVLQEQFFRRPENLKLTFVTDKGSRLPTICRLLITLMLLLKSSTSSIRGSTLWLWAG